MEITEGVLISVISVSLKWLQFGVIATFGVGGRSRWLRLWSWSKALMVLPFWLELTLSFFLDFLQKQRQQQTATIKDMKTNEAVMAPMRTVHSSADILVQSCWKLFGSSKVKVTDFSMTPPVFSATHLYSPKLSYMALVIVKLNHFW